MCLQDVKMGRAQAWKTQVSNVGSGASVAVPRSPGRIHRLIVALSFSGAADPIGTVEIQSDAVQASMPLVTLSAQQPTGMVREEDAGYLLDGNLVIQNNANVAITVSVMIGRFMQDVESI